MTRRRRRHSLLWAWLVVPIFACVILMTLVAITPSPTLTGSGICRPGVDCIHSWIDPQR